MENTKVTSHHTALIGSVVLHALRSFYETSENAEGKRIWLESIDEDCKPCVSFSNGSVLGGSLLFEVFLDRDKLYSWLYDSTEDKFTSKMELANFDEFLTRFQNWENISDLGHFEIDFQKWEPCLA